MKILFTLALLIAFSAPCFALGSFKSFINYRDDSVNSTERLRLKFEQDLFDSAVLDVEYELAGFFGGELSSPLSRDILNKTKPYFLGLDYVVSDQDDCVIRHRVDRLKLSWNGWTAGRDAVSFGAGRIFSPMDIFEPFGAAEIDRENKTGIDIIKYDMGLTDFSDATLLFAPSRESAGIAVARARATFSGFETSILTAQTSGESSYGFAFDGSVWDAGFRGEVYHSILEGRGDVDRTMLGCDYMFRSGLYVIGELYFNGFGAGDKREYDWYNYIRGDSLTLARRYLALGYSKDFWSLWTADGYVISNLDDGSRLYWQELKYSLSDDSVVKSGVMLSSGGGLTEFEFFRQLYYFQLNYYF